ncbi:hypothetical protein CFSAN001690_19240 [Salmonella enterica subsp. enterica serovar Cerro str. CFSAN001690]|nr:hypothetical protein CFSAN001691_18705 [Salmonella enterica subsp. enterica serovar Cerro str. CFSAN001691]ETB80161.1 hypothetical protein CFSAN001680_17010 [Salmonella enterica subsp. enterica serovar Cerro str. CFSAN001680]ETB85773.1 hypothetical protein CFSAN001690_19240 [Salmonella enterica subsp. enterica serovar Cerro str. CFSAN001690]ETB92017.1 hypothetical protein CFSAN001674_18640 [Salmonella enterica subsp. enterica serovar Cerro str. CFSAN001674]ETB98655.1 hypothetical protein CFS
MQLFIFFYIFSGVIFSSEMIFGMSFL